MLLSLWFKETFAKLIELVLTIELISLGCFSVLKNGVLFGTVLPLSPGFGPRWKERKEPCLFAEI